MMNWCCPTRRCVAVPLFALAALATRATPLTQAGPSPIAPVIQDCLERRDCSLRIHAIGHWVYFRAALSPEDLDSLISRGEADLGIVLRHSGTMRVLESIERIRFLPQAEDELATGVRLKLEFRRGSDHLADLYVAPTGEIVDGLRYYTTKDRNWPKRILDASTIVYGP